MAYVSWQLYLSDAPANYWANGTETLAPLNTDFNGPFLYVYPYLDIGNGSMTGVFDGILYMYENYGQLLINLLDAYQYNEGVGGSSPCSNAPQPGIGANYIEYTLSSITSTYNPNPIGWAFMFGPPLAGGYWGGSSTIANNVVKGISDALTIVGAFLPTSLYNQNNFALSANVYINYLSSTP
ncbi:MAG: hypothetical protein ACP5GZ_11985 [Vulcanisaeta sp.]|uniref:hypothetical protein n=1 Tax=Vulcanisaeta sp. TaxID=2020871 RepID=UPI003D0ED485